MKNIKTNYFYNVSYQLFALLVPLIVTPYISHTLSVNGIGIYSYTYAMVRYFWLLAALGCSTYGTRMIGIVANDEEKRSYNFWSIFLLKFILTFWITIVYILYIYFFSSNKIIALVQGIYLIAVAFDITWFFQGMEDFKKISIKNFIIKILNVIFIFCLIKKEEDLLLYIFGLAIFQLISNLSMWLSIKKYLVKINFKNIKPFKNLPGFLELFIPSIASQIFAVLDKSMIGWITNNQVENGYYEQAFKIIDMSLMIITTLSTIMVPNISRNFKEGKKKDIVKVINFSFKFVLFLSFPMIFGVIAISSKFVPIFFGIKYLKSAVILKILSLLFLIMGINSILGTQYFVSTGQQNKHTIFLAIGGSINVLINLLFIPKFKSIGAAIGSVCGELTICILEMAYIHKSRQLDIKLFFQDFSHYLISSFFMFIFLSIVIRYANDLLMILIIVAISFAIYIAILIILNDKFVKSELNNVLSKIKEKKKI